MTGFIIILILIAVIILAVVTGIRIVPQATEYVIERLGAYHTTWRTGIYVLFPILDRIRQIVDLREKTMDIKPQPMITKDNITTLIDIILFYQITDSKLLSYGVENYATAISNLSVTTLRNYVGDKELEQLLISREDINHLVTASLDQSTDRWGIKINRVEIQNIVPPQTILEALEKQMRAERERREMILIAEGNKQSAILVAEGAKAAEVLRAEGSSRAMVLMATSLKEKTILAAQGEAESLQLVQKATADSLRLLREADPSGELIIAVKGFEALGKLGEGAATKIIIPSNLQSVAGLAVGIKELIGKQ